MFGPTARYPYVVTWTDARGVERSARCADADEAARVAEQARTKGAKHTAVTTPEPAPCPAP